MQVVCIKLKPLDYYYEQWLPHNCNIPSSIHVCNHPYIYYVPYLSDAIATSGGYFGSVDGPIFLENVNCLGTEKDILECLVQITGAHNCHSQTVGVVCPGQTEVY